MSQGAQETLAEAGQEIAQHRLSWESYWSQEQGPQVRGNYCEKDSDKSKGEEHHETSFTLPLPVGQPGGGPGAESDDQCFRCGGLLGTSQSPDRGDRTTNILTDKPGKCGMAFDKVSFAAAGGAQDEGDEDEEDTRFVAKEHQEAGKAIVDSGATGSIGGIKVLESVGRLVGPEQIQIDPDNRPWFTFENGSRQQVMSRATFHMSAGRRQGKENFYVLDAPAG